MRVPKLARPVTRMALVLAVLGGAAGLGAGTASAAACQAWAGNQPPSPTIVTAVAVGSACDVWAESPSGFWHWTGGSAWAQFAVPVPETNVASMAIISPANIWAVGVSTEAQTSFTPVIMHWDGSAWTSSDIPITEGHISSVQALSASDVWAVGRTDIDQPVALHWNGSGWARVDIHIGLYAGTFASVAAISPGNVWISGAGQATSTAPSKILMEHWDGSNLLPAPHVPSPDGADPPLVLSAASANDIWAVGEMSTPTARTLVEHFDGQNWTQVYSPNIVPVSGTIPNGELSEVAAVSANNAWAFGSYNDRNGDGHEFALHYDGSYWARTVAPVDLVGVLGASVSGAEAWLLGLNPVALNSFVEPMAQAQVAVNANAALGLLGWRTKSVASANLAPGTNPAVAFGPDSSWEVAWQASSGLLWTLDSAGHQVSTGQQAAAGTSPGIAALSGGGFEVVFTSATDGSVQEIGPDGQVQAAGTGPAAAPGTSPVIAADGSGGFEAAYHATKTDHLWTVGTGSTGHDTGAVLAAGADPAVAHLAGGGFELVYPAASGALTAMGPDGSTRVLGSGPAVAAGTSPAAAAPAKGGGFEAVYEAASTGELWSVDPAGTTHDLGVAAAGQTSPAVAALLAGGFEVAYQAAPGRELFTLSGAGPARDSGVSLGVHDSPVMAVLPPTIPGTTTIPILTGYTDADARTLLTAAGLIRGAITADNSCRVPAGTVTGQSPIADLSAAPGDTVALTESSGKTAAGGPCSPVVPNLFGDDDATARQAIAGQGLTVGNVTTGSNCTVNKGDVFSQNPGASTPATPGQAVSFAESTGLDKNGKPCNVQ